MLSVSSTAWLRLCQVPREYLRDWKQLIEQYLENRESLKLCCLILDAAGAGWTAIWN